MVTTDERSVAPKVRWSRKPPPRPVRAPDVQTLNCKPEYKSPRTPPIPRPNHYPKSHLIWIVMVFTRVCQISTIIYSRGYTDHSQDNFSGRPSGGYCTIHRFWVNAERKKYDWFPQLWKKYTRGYTHPEVALSKAYSTVKGLVRIRLLLHCSIERQFFTF